MEVAGIQFSEDECEILEDLASDDLVYTMELALEKGLEAIWEAVDDCYRLLYRVALEEPSGCDLMVLADLAQERFDGGLGSQYLLLGDKLQDAYDLLPYEES